MGVFSDVYFWRQSIVLLANCMHSIGTGFMISFPSVLNPDILSPNSTIGIHATSDQASSLAGLNGVSGIVGSIVVPYFMQTYGRKYVSIALNFCPVIGFLIFVLANNVPCLFAGRIVQGVSMSAVVVLPMALGEYSHPKRRGYFMTIKKGLVPIGALLCHSLAFKCNWKQIAAVAVVPYVLAIILIFIGPESPSFFALTGKYDECEKSYMWLFGDNPKSKRELEDLITTQMERKEQKRKRNLKNLLRSLTRKDFMKPFIISTLLTMLIDASGKFYMAAYVVQILISVTKDKTIAAYCTIGSDVLAFAAFSLSCFVIRSCKRRTLLFTAGITSVILMCSASLMIFLMSRYDIGTSIFLWLTPIVILLNVFVVNVGFIPPCYTIMSEIFPLEHKGMGICATGIVFSLMYAIIMKCTPIMMEKTGVEGTLFIYALDIVAGLTILYFILNETKDKPLPEIEREIKGIKQPKYEENNFKDKPLIEQPQYII